MACHGRAVFLRYHLSSIFFICLFARALIRSPEYAPARRRCNKPMIAAQACAGLENGALANIFLHAIDGRTVPDA
jgi:hypothetical protein